MTPRIAVGLESTTDILITFPTIEALEDFSNKYKGKLSPQVKSAYEKIATGAGGEFPIDGRRKEAEKMLKKAEIQGAEIKYSFGGNASQQAATLERLNCEPIFLGGLFPNSFSKLDGGNPLKDTRKGLSKKFEKYAPASYILQVIDGNRYILTEGEGRRIEQLRSYLEKFPEKIEEAEVKYGDIDAISLVGWQVLFGNGIKEEDLKLAIKVIEKIQDDNDALLYTDAGGVDGLDNTEKNRLCRIYSLFDIISVNENEVIELANALGYSTHDKFRAMREIMENSKNTKTVWLHTKDFQSSISSYFTGAELKKAQELSNLAGLYKVENGDFPTISKIEELKDKRNHSKKGSRIATEMKEKFNEKMNGYEFTVTPAYKPEKFFSTVGAGDVSGATYLFALVDQ